MLCREITDIGQFRDGTDKQQNTTTGSRAEKYPATSKDKELDFHHRMPDQLKQAIKNQAEPTKYHSEFKLG
jgi:hypothetical protein